jgi:5-methylthioadenosine/S-adenosylhomocysteine deaminase
MIRFCSLLLLGALALGAEPADWVVSARWVLTMDPRNRLIENGAVAVRGDRIAGAGPKAEIDRRFQPRRRLDRPDAVLMPGLINTHTHAAMSLLRGIADDLRLQEWLEKHIFPAEAKNVSPEFVRWGTRLACLEMLLSGTTTFTDMYYFEDVAAEAAKEAGMRAVLGETVIGFPVADAKTPAAALILAERLIERFRSDPLIVPAVAPHALFTNSDETLKAARALANRHGAPLLIHLSETRRENDEIAARRKASPTRVLESLGILNGRTLAAHAVWVDEADLRILKAHNTGVAHCPSSNMKLASGAAPVGRMIELGLNVGLGPDGPAGSNNDFNLFEEIDLAAKLAKLSSGDPRTLPARTVLEMATIRGARALGLDREIGSLEAGKRADFIAVSLGGAHAWPMYGVESQLAYALKGSDVSDVWVNGRQVVANRRHLTLDARQIRAKVEEFASRVRATLAARERK